MNPYWSRAIRTLEPYTPGEQPRIQNLIKLNTNESPFAPSPKALAAICEAADANLRLYPDPENRTLKAALAQRHGLAEEEVFVGNGSDEVLAHIFCALLRHDAPVLFADITYSFYPVYCQLYGIAAQRIALDEKLRLRVEDYLPGAQCAAAGGIVIAHPNAPTGIALALAEIERIACANPQCVVVVDEAYIDFGGESALALLPQAKNILVVQTLSKSRSGAGLRVGWAMGDKGLIEALERVKNSFNSYPLDRLAQAGALAALADEDYFRQCCEAIIDNRAFVDGQLRAQGFEVLPSSANFVFARHRAHGGAEWMQALRARNILVRHFSQPQRIADYIRITIGSREQCQQLIAATAAILAAQ